MAGKGVASIADVCELVERKVAEMERSQVPAAVQMSEMRCAEAGAASCLAHGACRMHGVPEWDCS